MEKIISLINDLELDAEVTSCKGFGGATLVNKCKKVHDIVDACNVLQFDNRGVIATDQQKLLNKSGIYVVAGKKDNFGWLSAYITTKKGMILIW